MTFDNSLPKKITNDRKVNTTIYQSISLLDLIDDFCRDNNITRNHFFEKSSMAFMESFEKKIVEAA